MQSDPFLLWYRFPLDYIPAVSAQLNDAFVAALLTPAMALGERLRIEGVVSGQPHAVPALYCIKRSTKNGTQDSQSYRLIRPASIFRPSCIERQAPPPREPFFFSLGVDCHFTRC